ncbi:MAG: hypothetical protein HYZ28_01820 [Myxococcales bacterium]|nr:hypothetical protein [Myxococcales bacterium]
MTLNQFFWSAYAWADAHAVGLLLGGLALPAVGTALAFIGKGGKTDADGRFIASALVGVGFVSVLAEVLAIAIGVGVMDASLLNANLLLLLAPVLCLLGCLAGTRMVFPLSELGSVRTAGDLAGFGLACAAVVWFFSKFRGWGIVFFGSVLQLLVIAALTLFVLRRLYRRAFGLERASRQS